MGMFWPAILVSISLSASKVLEGPVPDHVLDHLQYQYCPENTFVIGFRVNLDPYKGPTLSDKDDVAISGLELHCGEPTQHNSTVIETIKTDIYALRNWTDSEFCPGYATGIQLKSRNEASLLANDLLGVTSVVLLCDGNTQLELGHEYLHNDISPSSKCGPGKAIHGFRTEGMFWKERAFSIFSTRDNKGLIDVRINCIQVPKVENACIPYDEWEEVFRWNNSNGESDITVSFQAKSGVANLIGSTTSGSVNTGDSSRVEGGISFRTLQNIRVRFTTELLKSEVTGFDWQGTNEASWTREKTFRFRTVVPAGKILRVNQVVGRCGTYNVSMNSFDSVLDGKEEEGSAELFSQVLEDDDWDTSFVGVVGIFALVGVLVAAVLGQEKLCNK